MDTANKIVKVKNRSNGMVIYSLPEQGIRREFAPGESRDLNSSELTALTYRPGGRELIEHYLLVEDADVVKEIALRTEPEYFLKEQDVIELLKSGSLDAFLDCLDFAPEGVLDLIKKYAISLPLNDSQKREAIKKKLGLDVDRALLNQRLANEDDNAIVKDEKASTRRVQPATEATPGRRTTGYKVTSRGSVEGSK